MLGSFRKSPQQLAAIGQIVAWVRERFKLEPADTVLVSEIACALPGCPPLETVIAFWSTDGRRHHFKVFKPVLEVDEADLPPAWYKRELAVPEDFECSCC